MKDRGPNWGLAFGSGSFLIVWLLGFLSHVPIETIALRACVATMMGAVVGMMVEQTLEGIRSLKEDMKKGQQVDFTVQADDDEAAPPAEAASASRTVPAAPPPAPPPAPAADDGGFAPLDFRQTARQVQATVKE